jgi:hypothetical protein
MQTAIPAPFNTAKRRKTGKPPTSATQLRGASAAASRLDQRSISRRTETLKSVGHPMADDLECAIWHLGCQTTGVVAAIQA